MFCCHFFQECLEFFNIPEARSAHYFLMDKRWNLIHYSKVRNAAHKCYSAWEHHHDSTQNLRSHETT